MSADAFRQALLDAGLTPPVHIEAGRLHRFPGTGKGTGSTAGWCKLFPDEAGGVYGDWASGLHETWQARRDKPITAAEQTEFRRQVEAAQKQAEAECQARHQRAAKKAQALWDRSEPAPDNHAYLVRKGIAAHGARLHGGKLLVPLRNDGELYSLQFIARSGQH